ncbi:MAG: hypothetical protein RR603_01400 [Kurthia sp.]
MNKNQKRKAQQKRWLKKRIKEEQRKKFITDFRNCFVKKGILKS